MHYGDVFKALNKAKIKYVVVGGAAVFLHGYRRNTDDLDLIVLLEPSNLSKMFDTMQSIGYIAKVPVKKEEFIDDKVRARWKKEKGMIVFSFVETKPPFKLIDMFVDEPIRFKTLYSQRIMVKLTGLTVPIASIDHLIQLKKIAGRFQDIQDIAQLREIKYLKKKR